MEAMVVPRLAAISRRRLLTQKSFALRGTILQLSSVLRQLNRTTNIRMSSSSSSSPTPNPLPATFLRGGTSKGIFLKKSDLPADQDAWDAIFLGIMGSPDAKYGRQLDGMGGGVSSLSKVMVVGPPSTQALRDQGVQCEYTFAQVGIRDEQVDYSGNCGNLSAVVGVFAVDEGLVVVGSQKVDSGGSKGREREAEATVRSYNTNTKKIVDTTFPVSSAGVPVLDLPEATIAGVPHAASRIILDFTHPAGAATGRLLPTSHPTDALSVSLDGKTYEVTASLVDATNPTVFVRLDALASANPGGLALPMKEYIAGSDPTAVARVTPVLEALRRAGAVKMGLDPDAQAQPKIALLSAPSSSPDSDHDAGADEGVDIVVHALSMGVLHKTVPMTVGLCLGVAAKTRGTIAWDIASQKRGQARKEGTERKKEEEEQDGSMVRLRHPGGIVDVGAEFGENGEVKSAKVVRTGRRLMKGVIWYQRFDQTSMFRR